jgi:hypothetical protein
VTTASLTSTRPEPAETILVIPRPTGRPWVAATTTRGPASHVADQLVGLDHLTAHPVLADHCDQSPSELRGVLLGQLERPKVGAGDHRPSRPRSGPRRRPEPARR